MSLCCICLKHGHRALNCKARKPCTFCGSSSHHKALCYSKNGSNANPSEQGSKQQQQRTQKPFSGPILLNEDPVEGEGVFPCPSSPENAEKSEKSSEETKPTEIFNCGSALRRTCTRNALLMSAKATAANVENESLSTVVSILLDTGSHRTFITEKTAKSLKLLSVDMEVLSVYKFASEKPFEVNSLLVEFNLVLRDGSFMKILANTVPQITAPLEQAPISEPDMQFLWQMSTDQLADSLPTKNSTFWPDILIGQDHFWDLIQMKNFPATVLPSGIYLIPSKLGYILSGKQTNHSDDNHVPSMTVATMYTGGLPENEITGHMGKADSCLINEPDLGDWSRLETIGITDDPKVKDDEVAMDLFQTSIKKIGNRYEAGWPWRPGMIPRFMSTIHRFERDPELLAKCANIFKLQEEMGVIERVDNDLEAPSSDSDHIIHYLPFQVVITPQKSTTKVRIVFDGSAKTNRNDLSLNECMYRGPVLLEDLPGLLLRFRMKEVAIISNIEKAFLID